MRLAVIVEMKKLKRLTPKTLRFIEAFDPSAPDWDAEGARAGKQVGYEPGYVKKVLMQRPEVIRELRHREEYGMSTVERNRKERQDFWRDTMQGKCGDEKMPIEFKDRLRASELWGKSEGDFVHKVEADVSVAPKLEEKLKKALSEEKDEDGSD